MEPAILEINLSALGHNYSFLKRKILPTTKLLGVVKANAYGSEAIHIAQKLQALGIDYLAVAYAPEGVSLRKNGIQIPILVLHPQPHHFVLILEHGLEPCLYSQKSLTEFIGMAKGKENYPVHLNINTGLNRLGFSELAFKAVCTALKNQTAIGVKGILSHLAASEDVAQKAFTLKQIENFNKAVKTYEKAIGNIAIKHLLNTSGILNYPQSQYNMVRSGLGLYGYSNHPELDLFLKPVATLKTRISQIHTLKKGDWVGYNMGFVASKKMQVATLPLGHADGISRTYGNGKGVVYIHGCPTPIIGHVCMDMMMVSLENITAQEGDTVLIFGKDASAENFAAGAKTISYELLTAIGPRVLRQIIEE